MATLPDRASAQAQPLPERAPAQAQPPYIEVDMSVITARNPFLIPGKKDFSAAGEVAVRGRADWSLGPGTVLDAEGNAAFRQYTRNYGNFVTGRAALTLDHRHNEFLSLRSTASFERLLPIEALTDTIDSAIDPISLEDRFELGQEVTWHTDAQTMLHGRFGWTRLDPRNSRLLESTSAFDAALDASRQIDAFTTIGVIAMRTWSRSASGGDPHFWSARATVDRRFAHDWRAHLELGVAQTSRLNTLGMRYTDPVQFAGSGRLCKEAGRISACITAAIEPVVSSFGGVRRETSAGGSLTWRTSEYGTLTAGASYRLSPGLTSYDNIDATSVNARYDRRLNRQLSVFAGADYRRRTDLSGRAANSVTFQIGVTIGIPRK